MNTPYNLPILYIICGLPFSGKTYLSNKISKYTNCTLISYDQLWLDKKNETGEDLSWEQLSSTVHRLIINNLRIGISVIYDTLNDTVNNREILRKIAQKEKGESIVIYTNTTLDTVLKRQVENKKSGDRHSVSEENFQNALKRFEPPHEIENALEFTPETDIEIWLSNLPIYTGKG
ncbi:MAG: ATP-binding protein [bacterium]|nr:ATP-binding protein [bacterium]